MGAEQLEESEFEPMFTACRPGLRGKKIALFGSYGWGDGEWMRTWEADCRADGAQLLAERVICNEIPGCRCAGGLHRPGTHPGLTNSPFGDTHKFPQLLFYPFDFTGWFRFLPGWDQQSEIYPF